MNDKTWPKDNDLDKGVIGFESLVWDDSDEVVKIIKPCRHCKRKTIAVCSSETISQGSFCCVNCHNKGQE